MLMMPQILRGYRCQTRVFSSYPAAMSRLLLASIVLLALFDIGLVVFGLVTHQYTVAVAGSGMLALLALLYLLLRRATKNDTE